MENNSCSYICLPGIISVVLFGRSRLEDGPPAICYFIKTLILLSNYIIGSLPVGKKTFSIDQYLVKTSGAIHLFILVKGTVQRDLRGVKSGINR